MEFFIYLVKVNIAIVVMYALYRLLFCNDTFFQWKRIFLLSILILAVLYPYINPVLSSKILMAFNGKIFPGYYLNEVIITANAGQSGGNSSFTDYLPALLWGIYWLGATILFVRMLAQIAGVFFMVVRAQKTEINGQTIYRKAGLQTPFSFFRYIVLDSQSYPAHELQEIIRHEETHVRQCHSLDMVWSEAMTVFCWFNPFIWLMKREIRLNLEYLADRSVIDSGLGREHYQFHLLRLTYHKAAATITNNFNVSPLKKRIFMMNKKETPRLGLAKYLFILPVIAALLSFNICDISKVKAAVSEPETLFVTTTETTPAPEMVTVAPVSESVKETPQSPKAQEPKKASTVKSPKKVDGEDVYQHVEQMPQFPGGDAALLKWLGENIHYPDSAAARGIQGRVNIRFVIRSDGSVKDVQIVKSLDPECDAEAIRVLEAMPKWIPGKQNGKAVSVYYNLPIVFKLSNK